MLVNLHVVKVTAIIGIIIDFKKEASQLEYVKILSRVNLTFSLHLLVKSLLKCGCRRCFLCVTLMFHKSNQFLRFISYYGSKMGCECCFMLTLNEIFLHLTEFKDFMSSTLGSRLYCVSVLMSLCASTVRI